MLVKGLTAKDPDATVLEQPWSWGDEVKNPFKNLLSMNIEGMFTADCSEKEKPEVDLNSANDGKGVEINADGLKKFAHIPLINTTLAYIARPVLQHPIEVIEAQVVRECIHILDTLLNNETFLGDLSRGGAFDAWSMPPEVEGLWATTK